jgi:hypothetical protein
VLIFDDVRSPLLASLVTWANAESPEEKEVNPSGEVVGQCKVKY